MNYGLLLGIVANFLGYLAFQAVTHNPNKELKLSFLLGFQIP